MIEHIGIRFRLIDAVIKAKTDQPTLDRLPINKLTNGLIDGWMKRQNASKAGKQH